ncbi:MAG: PhoPQ-activated pathogenicity-related family protein [Acidobacteria bacterium]|nr:PhoPQ-activated pathogenicity-related family protein [Acidobacteriota bacterium]
MLRRTVFLIAAAAVALIGAPKKTALDEYVAKPDPAYSWKLAHKAESKNSTGFVLEMTSQGWGEDKKLDRTKWMHWVTIVRPKEVKSTTGLLFITGGANDGRPRTTVDGQMAAIAEYTGSVVTELRMVPNQPLVFADDPQPGRKRNEDAIIAYTWRKYLETSDSSWPLRLPMTKAAVRAMDTVTAFMKSEEGGGKTVDKFLVAGGSKRGWTTWTTGAVDPRVVAMSPIVIDLLNVVPSFVHHYRAYGFWAPSVGDYFAEGLMDQMDNPRYKELMKIEEPYEYRERFTMPKLLINSAGDQFFLPDSWKFYYKDLKGEKHLRYVPNSDHSLRNTDAFESLIAFYDSILQNKPRPRYEWKVRKDGTIVVKTGDAPSAVKLWQATNPDGRDFRLEQIGPQYTSTELKPVKPGVYEGRVEKPAKGFTAYFVEMTFPSGRSFPFKFTSGVVVNPDTYPFAAPVKGQTKLGGRPAKR